MELSRLCEMQGISGREERVRMAIFRECEEVLGEENVKIDRTGNVIAHKACRKADAPRVMVAAHMDEVGLMVINAADDGLLQVRNIGGVDPRVLVSKRVKVGYDVPAREKTDVRWAQTCMELEDVVEPLDAALEPPLRRRMQAKLWQALYFRFDYGRAYLPQLEANLVWLDEALQKLTEYQQRRNTYRKK